MRVSTESERIQLELVAQGDAEAYRSLYDQYYLGVFRFASRYLIDRQVAEDITTEVFIKIWDQRDRLPGIRHLETYLFSAVRNACLNHLRNSRLHEDHHTILLRQLKTEAATEFSQHEITEAVFRHLEEKVAQLSPQQRAVMRCCLEGMKNDGIAAHLGISEKTVRNLKSQAIRSLRFALINNDTFLLFFLYICLFRAH